jgi:hypothetical protein
MSSVFLCILVERRGGSMRVRSTILVMVLGVLLCVGYLPVSATPALSSVRARVVIAEDRTVVSQCMRWINTPTNMTPCPLGTIIVSRETTYAEVQRRGITTYAVLTGNPIVDDRIHNELVMLVHKAVSPALPPSLQACTPSSVTTISTSAVTAGGNRFNEEVSYALQSTCAVTNVVDRAYAQESGKVIWKYSKNTDSSTIYNRNVSLPTQYTPYYSVGNSAKGQKHVVRMSDTLSGPVTDVLNTYF